MEFCRSLLLLTVEPHLIRRWSCCESPVLQLDGQNLRNLDDSPEITPALSIDESYTIVGNIVAASLSWVDLVSGYFFSTFADRFPRARRAERMLLSNLRELRRQLRAMQLSDSYCHDLLARIIFVQFLFDRKDTSNRAALDADKLLDLHNFGVLSKAYRSFADILNSYDDTYRLFHWLDKQFNGDLFPGKGSDDLIGLAAWSEEQINVRPEHLKLLSDFIRGDLILQSGQSSLWPLYAFDAIPLEFISTIYEEFVKNKAQDSDIDEVSVGVHYTPPHLVDFMLDRVLPWDSNDWDISILDPACGSGVFLVKAYQRLIYRWKRAHKESG